MGQKASDYSAVPLCAWHHRWEGSASAYHRLGRAAFERWHGVDIERAVAELNKAYGLQTETQTEAGKVA